MVEVSLNLEQDDKKYLFLIKSDKEKLNLNLFDQVEIENQKYIKNMTLTEVKQLNNCFSGLNSCDEFVDIVKNVSERKKISIIKRDSKLIVNLNIEYFYKNYSFDITLSPEKKDNDEIIKELYREITYLKNENKELKKAIENLKKEIKEIKELPNKPSIMKENEFDFIKKELNYKLNKEVKGLKKLYQARIDGDAAYIFHSKCDKIPNTLVIIESAEGRRFGGFVTKTWESTSQFVDDKNSFLFSLDKQKIYSYKNKNNNYAIENNKDYGPKFGGGHDIYIKTFCIHNKDSYTNESSTNASYNFDGDSNALSEDGKGYGVYIKDYEVYQIIFG